MEEARRRQYGFGGLDTGVDNKVLGIVGVANTRSEMQSLRDVESALEEAGDTLVVKASATLDVDRSKIHRVEVVAVLGEVKAPDNPL